MSITYSAESRIYNAITSILLVSTVLKILSIDTFSYLSRDFRNSFETTLTR